MPRIKKEKVGSIVRKAYADIATAESGCGCGPDAEVARGFAVSIGYTEEELASIPEEANLALGCGNPTALAGLRKGEVVLDLGSGAGFDCFLAATQVGPRGRVIGVDMTPEMIEKARENARRKRAGNVEFRLGEIEYLPVADSSVDVVISNCVINLSADKPRVFKEVRRVLKPGGRVSISDIALKKRLPPRLRESLEAYVGCVAGAVPLKDYAAIVRGAGLKGVRVVVKGSSTCIAPDTADPIGRALAKSLGRGETLDSYIASVAVEGKKPR
jgi:SAM-dependent methyltransferase